MFHITLNPGLKHLFKLVFTSDYAKFYTRHFEKEFVTLKLCSTFVQLALNCGTNNIMKQCGARILC